MRALMVCVLVSGFAALNWILLRENRNLRAEVEGFSQAGLNSQLPALDGYRLNGDTTQLTFVGEPRATLLLAFTETCPYCARTWPTWRSALQKVDTSRLRVVFVDLAAQPDISYLRKQGVDLNTLLVKPDRATAFLQYKLIKVPQAVLISPRGRVEKVWAGLLEGPESSSFISFLRLRARLISSDRSSFDKAALVRR